jgi:hypothetical protein
MQVHDGETRAVTRLLIMSYDVVDTQMAGPGIRYWEMARALGKSLEVTMVAPGQILPCEGVVSCAYTLGDWSTVARAVSEADAILLPGNLLPVFPQLATCGKPLIVETTCPYTFEPLQFHWGRPCEQQTASFIADLEITQKAASTGDFFFCGSQRQRDYWLGVLDALGRINPDTYTDDPLLYHLTDVVPLGLPSRRPEHTVPVMKGVMPGIGLTDRVVLWGGGLWQWLDPISLVRAVALVAEKHPNVRLVFPGTRRPNPVVPEMPMLKQTMDLSDRLGLTGKVTFFGDWVPYERWPNYLLEADLGASLHFDTLETHFAFRTRILDYIWAGLPMIVTGGDATSDLVAFYHVGEVVPPGDDKAVAAAMIRLLDTPNLRETYRDRFERVRPQLTWERICEPIVRFCQRPHLAPDRAKGGGSFQMPSEAALAAQVSQFQQERQQQQLEIVRLQGLVHGFEQGRFIRLMRWLHQWRRKLGL